MVMFHDDRVCFECTSIYGHAAARGGLTFPFTLDGKTYKSDVLRRGLGADDGGTFHPNCRCTLYPVEGLPTEPDELDELVFTVGAMGHSSQESARTRHGDEAVARTRAYLQRALTSRHASSHAGRRLRKAAIRAAKERGHFE